ncbi:MAG: 6-phosphofructokinase [Lachnospiraceae bacterium]
MKNLIVGQAGGTRMLLIDYQQQSYGVIREGLNRSEEIEHVYGMINGIQGFLDGRFMDVKELDNDTLEALRTTPGAYLGSCRFKLPDDLNDAIYPLLFQKFEEMNIGYFFYIGGN